jgi:hypothetical protein
MEELARDKHSSIPQKLVNYRQKCFITLAPVADFIKLFMATILAVS